MRKLFILLFVIFISLFLFACETNGGNVDNNGNGNNVDENGGIEEFSPVNIDFRFKMSTTGKMNYNSNTYVATSMEDLNNIWSEEFGFSTKNFKNIDFTKESVLGISYQSNDLIDSEVMEIMRYENDVVIDLYLKTGENGKNTKFTYFLVVSNEDLSKDDNIIIKENQYEYVNVFIDAYTGGCELYEYNMIFIKGKEVELKYYSSSVSGIDMNTLKVYSGKCVFTEDLHLKLYGSKGVENDRYIMNYISNKNNIKFSDFVKLHEIEQYDYQLIENNDIVFTIDNITYTLKPSKQFSSPTYYVSKIQSNEVLFGSTYENAINILKILFNNDTVFESGSLKIELDKNGYVINLVEYFIAG